MKARTAARSISAAALTGGLTLGFAMSASTASAMPTREASDSSVGAQCQAARAALADGVTLADGMPGLRCGQAFGKATPTGSTHDDSTADASQSDAPDTGPQSDHQSDDGTSDEGDEYGQAAGDDDGSEYGEDDSDGSDQAGEADNSGDQGDQGDDADHGGDHGEGHE